jgi:small subunit ribosomal protein S6e
MRRRRTFRGNTISEETVQINLVVEQKGPKPLAELFAAA